MGRFDKKYKILLAFGVIFSSFACSTRAYSYPIYELKKHSLKFELGGGSIHTNFYREELESFLHYYIYPEIDVLSDDQKKFVNNAKNSFEERSTDCRVLKLTYSYFINPYIGIGGGIATSGGPLVSLFYGVDEDNNKCKGELFFRNGLFKPSEHSSKKSGPYLLNIGGVGGELFLRITFNLLKDYRIAGSGKRFSFEGYTDLGYKRDWRELYMALLMPGNFCYLVSENRTPPYVDDKSSNGISWGIGFNVGYYGFYLNLECKVNYTFNGGFRVDREKVLESKKQQHKKLQNTQIQTEKLKKFCKYYDKVNLTFGYDFGELFY